MVFCGGSVALRGAAPRGLLDGGGTVGVLCVHSMLVLGAERQDGAAAGDGV